MTRPIKAVKSCPRKLLVAYLEAARITPFRLPLADKTPINPPKAMVNIKMAVWVSLPARELTR